MLHEVFVSYSQADRARADAVCLSLEQVGIRCWIAPRDVPPGVAWGGAIVQAIRTSRVLLVVLSASANASPNVLREVDAALQSGVPILPLRVEDVSPSPELAYYLHATHWLDAWTPPLEGHLQRLAQQVTALLGRSASPLAGAPPSAARSPGEAVVRRRRPLAVLLVAVAAAVGAAGLWAGFAHWFPGGRPPRTLEPSRPSTSSSGPSPTPSTRSPVLGSDVTRSVDAGDTVVDEHGLPLMLVTTRETTLHGAASPESDWQFVGPLRYWYVLPPDPATRARDRNVIALAQLVDEGYYRVASGTLERDAKGYISRTDVLEWRTRDCLLTGAGRPRVLLYATPEDARRAARGTEVPPLAEEDPSTSPEGALPVLSSLPVGDDPGGVVEVAFLPLAPLAATLDVVLVLDTSAGMAPVLTALREAIERVARVFVTEGTAPSRLRLGVVAYRDVSSVHAEAPPVARVVCTLPEGADLAFVARRLATLEASLHGDQEAADDALAGLELGLDSDRLGRRALSWPILLLLTDSSLKDPAHPEQGSRTTRARRLTSIEAVRTAAQPDDAGASSVTLSAMLFTRAERTADTVLAERQLSWLVAGRSYQGFLDLVGPDGRAVTETVSRRLLDLARAMDEAMGEAVAPAARVAQSYRLGARFRLRGTDMGAGRGMGRRIATGYCPTDGESVGRAPARARFVRKGSLKLLRALLVHLRASLESVGDPGARPVSSLVDALKVSMTSLGANVEIEAGTTVRALLGAVSSIPLRHAAFDPSLADLAGWDEDEYQAWSRRIDRIDAMLGQLIEDAPRWMRLHPDARELDEHSVVAESELP
jgi:hypothetical protein